MATFPPATAPTTRGIPSYLYTNYNDDSDLQAFVATYNAMAQQYIDELINFPLPVYTNTSFTTTLLDWIAQGYYGITRPGFNTAENPYTDDFFRRILTWNFYKGDGLVMSDRWLRRRVARFYVGTNGTDPDPSLLVNVGYQITLSYTGSTININIKLTPIPQTGTISLFVFGQAFTIPGLMILPFQYPTVNFTTSP